MKQHGFEYLGTAVHRCDEDLVDFILDCGVDPVPECDLEWSTYVPHGMSMNPISKAAAAGSLGLVKNLLARGARVDQGHIAGWHAAFTYALAREHMDMARFLLTLRNPSRGWKKKLITEG